MAYLIALNEGGEHGSVPTTDDLYELDEYLGDVQADAWLLDIDGMQTGLTYDYCTEEPTGDCIASVTVVLDEELRIHYLGATHDRRGFNALDVLLDVLED